jgi:hypothetical protein
MEIVKKCNMKNGKNSRIVIFLGSTLLSMPLDIA